MELQSLVGVNVEFRKKGVPLVGNYDATIKEIQHLTEIALDAGIHGVYLLGEMVLFYRKKNYYPVLRPYITMGRLVDRVQDYVDEELDVKKDVLLRKLKDSRKRPRVRTAVVEALRLLLKRFPHYLNEFKKELTNEERRYIISA